MAVQENYQSISLPAAGDLSSAGIYRWGLVNSSGQVAVVASAGGDADGIIQNSPAAAGRATELAFSGVAKTYVGTGGVTAGDKVQSDANGASITAASGDHVLGKALATGAADAIVPVLMVSKHILT
jgi:hypothetical protein